MEPVQLGIFQQILEAIASALAPGAQAVRGTLMLLFIILLWLEVNALVYAFLFNGHILSAVANLVLRSSMTLWLIVYLPNLLAGLQEFFVTMGLLAGGNRITIAQFLDPGEYLRIGINVMRLLYAAMTASFGLTSIPQGIGYFFLWICFMAAFAVMAVNVFIWQIELLIAGVMMVVMLPTLVFRSFRWIGQGTLSLLVNLTFRFGLGALLASATFPVLELLTITRPVSFQSVCVSVIGGWIFAYLFTKVNSMASRFLGGMPALSAGGVLAGMAATAAGLAGAAAGVGAVAGGAAAAIGTAGRGALAMAQSAGGAARGFASGAPQGTAVMGALRGGQQGFAQASSLRSNMGSFASWGRQTASSQGAATFRHLANTSRYLHRNE